MTCSECISSYPQWSYLTSCEGAKGTDRSAYILATSIKSTCIWDIGTESISAKTTCIGDNYIRRVSIGVGNLMVWVGFVCNSAKDLSIFAI